MKHLIQMNPPEYFDLPAPDPKSWTGRFLYRTVSPDPTFGYVADVEIPHSRPIPMSEEHWELKELIAPKWIRWYGNSEQEFGYYQVTRWYTWDRVAPPLESPITERKLWEAENEIARLRFENNRLRTALDNCNGNELAQLYITMLEEERIARKKKEQEDADEANS